ncbi:PAS domain S-box protein [Neobacillus notoginsengisoli]|uniref:histidine kinase n=1 Tax=Neobacillus notoginsengisoli TaxID=1578198 RepID=A0A417YWK4_9BACI|nr:PAS domain S-box protein [Neobacillus notoginsengisoli]RHW41716.1 PAS domain S-box protein [Neobacillus notoginsengisoli]
MSDSTQLFGDNHHSADFDADQLIDLFLNCNPDGFAIVDMDNRFVKVNPMYCKIFGFEEHELIGRNVHEYLNSERVMRTIEEVKKGRMFTNIKSRSFRKDGRLIDIAVSYSPFRNAKEEIIAVIVIVRDITDAKVLERELERTQELYRLITENTSDLISVFANTKERTFIYASPSHEKLFGLPISKIVGKSFYDFVSSEDAGNFELLLERYRKTGEPIIFEKELKLSSGKIVHLEYNISPTYNDKKEIETFVAVARNNTDRVNNEKALRNLDRLSIIGQLAAGVAHEIRNPLTSLKGFSKLLQNDTSRDKQEQYLDIIRNELDRIDMIVNEFMSLAKPQAIQFSKVQLISIVESTINILQPQAMLHNVQIKTDYPAEDIELLCSPNQLKQVFVNFIKNAIEAMPDGGNVFIKIRRLTNRSVLIAFTDEGTGIDPDVIKFLGTPFYTTKDKGIGLGLTVSNKIIQEHKGSMKIDSQAGIGTTISVELECLEP